MFQSYKRFWSCLPLWTATCLHSVSYTTLFFWHTHAENPTIQTQNSWLSHFLLLWTPRLENTTETCLMVNFLILFCSLVFRTPISQISSSNTELSSRLDDCISKLTIQNCLQTRHWQVNPQTNYYCQLHHASSSVRKRCNNIDKLQPAAGWGGGGGGGEKLH